MLVASVLSVIVKILKGQGMKIQIEISFPFD